MGDKGGVGTEEGAGSKRSGRGGVAQITLPSVVPQLALRDYRPVLFLQWSSLVAEKCNPSSVVAGVTERGTVTKVALHRNLLGPLFALSWGSQVV